MLDISVRFFLPCHFVVENVLGHEWTKTIFNIFLAISPLLVQTSIFVNPHTAVLRRLILDMKVMSSKPVR